MFPRTAAAGRLCRRRAGIVAALTGTARPRGVMKQTPDLPPGTSSGAPPETAEALGCRISACSLCAARFAVTASAHQPRPVVWFRSSARLLIVGQAPGMRVHLAGEPFRDASGDRLRAWMGVSDAEFYDLDRVAIVPMAFCFPGYNAAGSDLPPPAICAATWRAQVMAVLPRVALTLLVGGAAQGWHLGRGKVSQRVADWQHHAPAVFPLPHPSWRNTGWLRRNPWFDRDVIPALQAQVRATLG